MKKILIIDDEKDIRILLSSILKEEGYSCIVAGTVKEAENIIENDSFDLVLLDISLDDKKKDGIYILKKIKKINKDIPVIMISGHATIQVAVESVKLGAFEFSIPNNSRSKFSGSKSAPLHTTKGKSFLNDLL